MVKALFLGLLAATMCGFASAVPPRRARHSLAAAAPNEEASSPPPPLLRAPAAQDLGPPPPSSRPSLEEEDPAAAVRSERSTNLSFTTSAARRIQMYFKNQHLQLLPDGTVNGTSEDSSAYTILQRTTVGIGQLRIQGIATCQYLCMNHRGLLYGSREFGDECVFNETIGTDNYNTYSSTKYSNQRRTLYLALNKCGQPRKVMLRARQQLGRLSSYTRVLTRPLPHRLRHLGEHQCSVQPTGEPTSHVHPPSTANPPASSHLPRCRKRKKRKKKKRNHGGANRKMGHGAAGRNNGSANSNNSSNGSNSDNRKCVSGNSDECQRGNVTEKKRQKTKIGDKQTLNGAKKKKHPKGAKAKKPFFQGRATTSSTTSTTTTSTTTESSPSPTEEVSLDEDYAGESTTFLEYEYSTATDTATFPHPD